MASSFGLSTKTIVEGDRLQILVSKKIQLSDLLKEVLLSGETEKYRVILPLVGVN